MYKRGIVTEVDANTARVRVKFPSQQDLVSGWLDVLQTSTHGDADYQLPPVGNRSPYYLTRRATLVAYSSGLLRRRSSAGHRRDPNAL